MRNPRSFVVGANEKPFQDNRRGAASKANPPLHGEGQGWGVSADLEQTHSCLRPPRQRKFGYIIAVTPPPASSARGGDVWSISASAEFSASNTNTNTPSRIPRVHRA